MLSFTQHIGDNDVMLGRGSPANQHPGNIAFRAMILQHADKYHAITARGQKAVLANHIISSVHGAGGRFLRKLSRREVKMVEQAEQAEQKEAALDKTHKKSKNGTTDWFEIIADHYALIQKTNQAFRLAVRKQFKAGSALSPRKINKGSKIPDVSPTAGTNDAKDDSTGEDGIPMIYGIERMEGSSDSSHEVAPVAAIVTRDHKGVPVHNGQPTFYNGQIGIHGQLGLPDSTVLVSDSGSPPAFRDGQATMAQLTQALSQQSAGHFSARAVQTGPISQYAYGMGMAAVIDGRNSQSNGLFLW